jgi:hypothetical protein
VAVFLVNKHVVVSPKIMWESALYSQPCVWVNEIHLHLGAWEDVREISERRLFHPILCKISQSHL